MKSFFFSLPLLLLLLLLMRTGGGAMAQTPFTINPETGRALQPSPTLRQNAMAASVGEYVVIAGGWDASSSQHTNSITILSTNGTQWTNLNSGGTVELSTTWWNDGVAVAVKNYGVVIASGNCNQENCPVVNGVKLPSLARDIFPNLAQGRRLVAGASVRDVAVFAGGMLDGSVASTSDWFEIYNTTSGTKNPVGYLRDDVGNFLTPDSPPQYRAGMGGCGVFDRYLVFGGGLGRTNSVNRNFFVFDMTLMQFLPQSQQVAMLQSVFEAPAACVGDRILFIGGRTGVLTDYGSIYTNIQQYTLSSTGVIAYGSPPSQNLANGVFASRVATLGRSVFFGGGRSDISGGTLDNDFYAIADVYANLDIIWLCDTGPHYPNGATGSFLDMCQTGTIQRPYIIANEVSASVLIGTGDSGGPYQFKTAELTNTSCQLAPGEEWPLPVPAPSGTSSSTSTSGGSASTTSSSTSTSTSGGSASTTSSSTSTSTSGGSALSTATQSSTTTSSSSSSSLSTSTGSPPQVTAGAESDATATSGDSSALVAVVVIVSLCALIAILVVVFLVVRRKRQNQSASSAEQVEMGGRQGQTSLFHASLATPAGEMAGKLELLSDVLLEDQIGEGNFGAVWKGKWQGTPVACKCLTGDVDVSEIEAEATLLASLNHPNIVNLLGLFVEQEKGAFLVFEFADSGSLLDAVRRLSLPQDPAEQASQTAKLVRWLLDAARGMEYVASRGVVHRDLGCRNLLLSGGRVSVCDFGLSRMLPEGDSSYTVDAEKKRSTALPIRWCPRELLQQGTASELSDAYSFGIVIWESFSFGALPFSDKANAEVLVAVIAGQTHVSLLQPAGCPDDVYALALRCWSLIPEDRPRFSEIRQELEQILSGFPGFAPPATPVSLPPATNGLADYQGLDSLATSTRTSGMEDYQSLG